jgi:hypothetical protein
MVLTHPPKPRVFIDADVLFAGAASPQEHGASLMVLRLAELTLIDVVTSQQVVAEAERNLDAKLPRVLPVFQLLIDRSLRVVRDPSWEELLFYKGWAEKKDLPVLVAALREQCSFLVTFNLRHYYPGKGSIIVFKPGDFVLRVRDLLTQL